MAGGVLSDELLQVRVLRGVARHGELRLAGPAVDLRVLELQELDGDGGICLLHHLLTSWVTCPGS
jgi:hypothetical protein